MSPRHQRMYEAIRECLLRPAALTGLVEGFLSEFITMPSRALRDAMPRYADEAARTLVGVVDEVLHEEHAERDAAVRELLAVAERLATETDEAAWQAIAAVRKHYPEGT